MNTLRIGAQGLAVALVAGLLALLVWKVAHQVGDATIAADVHKGRAPKAPTFNLPLLDGGTLTSGSLDGKAQVVNFWASWCIPCREEAKLLNSASAQYASRVVVLGVDHQDFKSAARSFVRRHDVTYPNVFDTGDNLYDKYGLTGVPETFCADRRGRVVAHVPGAVTRDTLDQCIQDALSS